MTVITNFPDQARAVFAFVNEDKNWSPYRAMVRNVFLAYPERALSQAQVEAIARAVEGLPADADLSDALAFLVRRKGLRTRQSQPHLGKRHKLYEINF